MPTSRNNQEAIETGLRKKRQWKKYGKDYTKGDADPISLSASGYSSMDDPGDLSGTGRQPDSSLGTGKKQTSKQVNSQVQVSQEEYDEIMAIKPLFPYK